MGVRKMARKYYRLVFVLAFIATLVGIQAILGEINCSEDGTDSLCLSGSRRVVKPDLVKKENRETKEKRQARNVHRIEPDWTDDEEDMRESQENEEGEEEDQYEYEDEFKDDHYEAKPKAADAKHALNVKELPVPLGKAKLNDISLGKVKYTDSIRADNEEYFRKIDEYKPRIDPHTYRYKLNPKGICRRTKQDQRDLFLIIFVNTAPGNFLKRVYMRNTFGKESAWPLAANEAMRIVFSIGAVKDPRLQAQIYQESEMFGDIVQEDFMDHYWNMTLKSIMGFKWTTIFCRRASFAMKMDDDVLLNPPLIYKVLKESPTANFTLGDVLKDLGPVRDKKSLYSKFYTPKHVYQEDEYPPFYGGSSYIMSTDVVEKTYYMALRTPLIPWSDVFIGICFHKVGITPGHRHLFRQNARFRIVEDGGNVRLDDERLTYLKQHMSMYHLSISHSKMLWDVWMKDMCTMQCVKPTQKPSKRYKVP